MTRLYPEGTRLANPERNLAMARAPRAGKEILLWGRNIHGGRIKADKCERRRDLMSEQNLPWAVAAELIRRGDAMTDPPE